MLLARRRSASRRDASRPPRLGVAFRAAKSRLSDEGDPVWGNSVAKGSRQLQQRVERDWGYGTTAIKPPVNFTALASYLQINTWHQRCCRVKAEVATGELAMVKPRDGDADRPALNQLHAQFLRKIIRQAHDKGGGYDKAPLSTVLYRVEFDVHWSGNGYIEAVRDKLWRPAALYHVPSVHVRRGWDAERRHPFGYWQVSPSGGRIFFKDFGDERRIRIDGQLADAGTPDDQLATELLHLSCYSPAEQYYGIPEWLPALLAVEGSHAAANWNADRFLHNSIPRKIITFFGAEESEDLREILRDYFTSVSKGRNHEPLVMFATPADGFDAGDARLEVKDLESSPQDAGFLKYLEGNRDEIVAAHGVPPSLVGVQAAGRLGGKGSDEAQRRDFKRLVIEPRQRRMEEVLNERLVADDEDGWGIEEWVLKLGDFDLRDQSFSIAKAEQLRKLVASGLMTPNEARVELGMDPVSDVPAADELMVMGPGGGMFLRQLDPTSETPPAPATRPMPGQAEQTTQSEQLAQRGAAA